MTELLSRSISESAGARVAVGRVDTRSPNRHLVGLRGGAKRLASPALILEWEAFQANIRALADRCSSAGVALRPHAKTHKSARIAQLQMDNGARGICCATPHEALILGQLGIPDILLTTPVSDRRRAADLAGLAGTASLGIVVDHSTQIDMWVDVLDSCDAQLWALVDFDIGMGRTGARGQNALQLAARLRDSRRLTYRGVQAYSGMVQHVASYELRKQAYMQQLASLTAFLRELDSQELHPEVVTGGGTGTFDIDLSAGLLNELQCGSYIFMDVEYNAVELTPSGACPFASSLYLRASVLSANVPGQVTVDAGFKALAVDGPPPVMRGDGGCTFAFFGDEYGRITDAQDQLPQLGEQVDLVVSHCDPTVNLHDYIHVVDGEDLIDIWPVDARGVL